MEHISDDEYRQMATTHAQGLAEDAGTAVKKLEKRVTEIERRLAALTVEPIHGHVIAPLNWPRR